MTIDYQIQLIQFPDTKTKETVVENEDGSYTIFIEASLDSIRQREAFLHAMKHILGDDFEKEDINKIEYVAHDLDIIPKLCPTLYGGYYGTIWQEQT